MIAVSGGESLDGMVCVGLKVLSEVIRCSNVVGCLV